MNKEQYEYKINRLLALLLFAIYAVCILLVLLTGANLYKKLTLKNQNSYAQRTAIQYFTTRVRQNDKADAIDVCQFGEADALILKEQIQGKEYETLIYCYDGYLREIFSSSVKTFSPKDGNIIIEMKSLILEKENGTIYAEITDQEGTVQRVELLLRSGKEVLSEK